MKDWHVWKMLIDDESSIRLTIFLGVLVVMALWEIASPRRRREIPRVVRWSNNFLLVALDTLIVRLCFPMLGVGLATVMSKQGLGILNIVGLPFWFDFIASVVLLDLIIYFQHVLFHAVPFLWRFHKVHHSDTEFDLSTGVRFHPVEIIMSMGIKLSVISALGPPAVAVLVFELLLNASSVFNHSNIFVSARADRLLRLLIVTPDMHRVHHSIHKDETNSNFGFNLSWWDRVLGTYHPQPRDGHETMTIGVDEFRSRREHWIDKMLIAPFRNPAGKKHGTLE